MSLGIPETGISLANRMLMTEKTDGHEVLVFVEGCNDHLCLNKCFSKDVVIKPANKKQHVLEAVRHYLDNTKFNKVIFGIIDRDFDFLLDKPHNQDNVFYTDHGDMLITCFLSRALENITIKANINKNIDDLRNEIFDKSSMPAIIRLLNEKFNLEMSLDKYAITFSGKSIADACGKLLSEKLRDQNFDFDLIHEITCIANKGYDKEQLCQGHDVCSILREEHNLNFKVEDTIVNAYDVASFRATQLYHDIRTLLTKASLEDCLL